MRKTSSWETEFVFQILPKQHMSDMETTPTQVYTPRGPILNIQSGLMTALSDLQGGFHCDAPMERRTRSTSKGVSFFLKCCCHTRELEQPPVPHRRYWGVMAARRKAPPPPPGSSPTSLRGLWFVQALAPLQENLPKMPQSASKRPLSKAQLAGYIHFNKRRRWEKEKKARQAESTSSSPPATTPAQTATQAPRATSPVTRPGTELGHVARNASELGAELSMNRDVDVDGTCSAIERTQMRIDHRISFE